MSGLKILHTADLHLDSAFEGISAAKAAVRRAEQRELLARIAELVRTEQIDLVLLPGDLLDSDNTYLETGEQLLRSLNDISVPVFIAPGNHDYYSSKSPYARLKFKENVHIFSNSRIESVLLPELNARVYGAAFTDLSCPPLLEDFHAEQEPGITKLLCIHGEVGAKDSKYNPISTAQLAASGIDYAALGHIHKASGLQRAANCFYACCGCPEGRGFDETGEKTVSIIELDGGECRERKAVIASRRYEILKVDISGQEALSAVRAALPDGTEHDIYRVILTGESDASPSLESLRRELEDGFFQLQLRDESRLCRSIWDKAGEDTLRGIFLAKLRQRRDSATSEAQRTCIEQAARWGLAALDNMEEAVSHDY